MCRLLGFRFAPRIRGLKEKRLYVWPGMPGPPELASLAAGAINLRVISDHWFELLRLALSIKTGTVAASVILRKLAGMCCNFAVEPKIGVDDRQFSSSQRTNP